VFFVCKLKYLSHTFWHPRAACSVRSWNKKQERVRGTLCFGRLTNAAMMVCSFCFANVI
jgi:hypothetical protein